LSLMRIKKVEDLTSTLILQSETISPDAITGRNPAPCSWPWCPRCDVTAEEEEGCCRCLDCYCLPRQTGPLTSGDVPPAIPVRGAGLRRSGLGSSLLTAHVVTILQVAFHQMYLSPASTCSRNTLLQSPSARPSP
jgi:hypothetical protein